MAMPLIISPCATLAVLPPQELTTQQMVSKVLLCSGLNGVEGPGETEHLFISASFESSSGFSIPGIRVTEGNASLQRGPGGRRDAAHRTTYISLR